MKKKKIILFFIITIITILMAIPSFATEQNNEMVGKTIKQDIVVTNENYYELKEELYKKDNSYKPKTYNSDSNTLTLKEYIIQEVRKHNEAIDITAYQIPFEDMYATIIPMFEYDELFPVSQVTWDGVYLNYDYATQTGDAIGKNVIFTYSMTQAEIDEKWTVIDATVKDYLSGIKSEWNDLEKVIYTNNYLCRNCVYATTIIDTSHTIVGSLVDKLPVCDGYSKGFRYLLKQVGIEAELATSDSMKHAWNLVKLDDDYYHIDVTWNDSMSGVGKLLYKFFLASDSEFETNREHSDWVANHEATNTKYDTNPEWNNVNNYLIYKDNYWYSLSNSQATYTIGLHKIDFRNGNQTEITTIPTEYVFWSPGLTTDNEYLYFSTKYAMWKMNFDGTDVIEFFRLPDETKAMFSIDFSNNKYYYDTTDIIKDAYGNQSSSVETLKNNVYSPILKINLDRTSMLMEVNDSQSISVTIVPEDTTEDKTIKWTSSDETIATVDENGNVVAVKEGQAIITAASSNGKQATCNIEVVDKIIYTTFTTEVYESSEAIVFNTKTLIESQKIADYFPVINKGYTVEVYAENGTLKTDTEYLGSRNIIKLKNLDGIVEKEYIVAVNGDVNGDGQRKIYDAFQILKDSLLPNKTYDEIDFLIRDFNNDEAIRMFDAFQYLKKAILG